MKRICPVCNSSNTRQLYRQNFTQISEAFPIKGYDVVVCRVCGFGYADNVPSQEQLDTYYKNLSKYENKHQAGKVSKDALANYQKIVESVSTFLPDKRARIADIGSATGALLSVFRYNGYSNLIGIDPSPSCAQTAADMYGMQVVTSSLFDLELPEQSFDMLVFSSVMEHVIDLTAALPRMRGLLGLGGLMFIEVPDTVNFATWISAPFQQFSIEHVNFFSPISLSNLMRRHGFEPVAIWHDISSLGGIKDPSLTTVFRKVDIQGSHMVRDYEAEIALTRYVERSKDDDDAVLERINLLVNSRQPILVWGTGTQAQRLLAGTGLASAQIRAFVDSNPNYQGKQLNGIRIIAPNEVSNYPDPIVISSRVFQTEITIQIRDVLHLKNKIINLFGKTSLEGY